MVEDKPEKNQPEQHQDRMPAIESEMAPEPIYEDEGWVPRGDLEGKVALVTGGDSGIGRAVCVLFAKEGADVAFAYLDEHGDAETTATRVRELGRRCVPIPGDLSDPAHSDEVVSRVREEFGHVDVLVNNASVQYVNEEFEDSSLDEIRKTLDSNVLSTLLLTQRCLALMPEGSSIVTTTSVTAFRGSGHLVTYSATKGALLAFTRALSQQLLKRGIRVNGVAPGPVWTPLIAGSFPAEEVATFGQQAPMKRAGQPFEIAPSYLFLACPRYSSYITGQVIHPNGGEVINA